MGPSSLPLLCFSCRQSFLLLLHHSLQRDGSTIPLLPRLRLSRTVVKMVQSSILGFPRMGANRDLKKATEAYWAGKISQDDLLAEGKRLRLEHWKIQKDAGIDIIPSNDFAFYDQVLDHIQLFGVIPERYSKSMSLRWKWSNGSTQ